MSPTRLLKLTAKSSLLVSALWLTSCKTTPPPPPVVPEVAKKPAGLFEWRGEGKSITSVMINVDEQKARLYNGEEEIGWTYVASGITSFPTPIGEFKVLEKIADKVSNLYGKGYNAKGDLVNSDFKQGRDLLPAGGRFEPAKMTYFMRLTGDGVGMHIGPIPRPGRRASHGCIRLPSKFAGTIFKNISVGTPVTITGSGPDYATYVKQSNAKAAANSAKLAAAKKKAAEAAASALEATTLPPGDPNGPVTTPPAGTTPPATTAPSVPAISAPTLSPAPAPGPALEEIKPAAPVPAAPTGN
jgi:hypothetical protein